MDKKIENKFLEKQLNSKIAYQGKMLTFRVDEVLLPNNKKSTRELINHPGAVAIIPVLDNGNIVFVSQYRYCIGESLYEIPAGKLEKNEEPLECAKRELEEETGYSSDELELIGTIYTTPGFSDEKIYIYKATKLIAGKQHTDEDEFVDCVDFDCDTVKHMVKNGTICDAKTLSGLYLTGFVNE